MSREPVRYHYRHRVPPGAVWGLERRARRRWPALIGVAAVLLAAYLGFRLMLGPAAPPAEEGPTAEADGYRLAYPTYLGGPERRRTGNPPEPQALEVLWRVEIGSGPTQRADGTTVQWSGTGWTGQPTLTYDTGVPSLVIGGYDHGLRRIRAESGEVVWRAELDDVVKGTNTVYYDPRRPEGDRVVVVTGSRRGWGLDLGDPSIAPLRAFSFETGTELWRLPVPRTDNYSQDVDASPLWLDGRLIVALEPGYVFALDPEALVPGPGGHPQPSVVASSPLLFTAGDIAAHAESAGPNLALEGSPAVLGDRIYIASSSGHVYGLDRKSLAVVWDFDVGGDFDSTVVVTEDGRLLVGMERQYVAHGGVFLLDPARPPDDAVVWFFPSEDRGISEWTGGTVGSVAVNDPGAGEAPLAAFTSVDGNLYVVHLDRTSGTSDGPTGQATYPKPTLVFRDHIGGSISTPAFVGNAIVAAGFDKTVHLYRVTWDNGSPNVAEVDSFGAEGMFESTPLVWEGRVYIGCRDGYLYCLGAPPP